MTDMVPQRRASWAATGLLVLGLLGLALPWWHGPSAALTLNAYDLAEVLTLRLQGDRWLWPALLLRLPFALWPALLWLSARAHPSRGRRGLHGALALLCGVALVPPPSLVSTRFQDANAVQQALVAAFALALLVGAALLSRRWHRAALAGLGLLAGVAGLAGLWLAGHLLDAYGVPWRVGVGPLVFGVATLVGAWWLWARERAPAAGQGQVAAPPAP